MHDGYCPACCKVIEGYENEKEKYNNSLGITRYSPRGLSLMILVLEYILVYLVNRKPFRAERNPHPDWTDP